MTLSLAIVNAILSLSLSLHSPSKHACMLLTSRNPNILAVGGPMEATLHLQRNMFNSLRGNESEEGREEHLTMNGW